MRARKPMILIGTIALVISSAATASATEETGAVEAVETARAEVAWSAADNVEVIDNADAIVFQTDSTEISIDKESAGREITIASEEGEISFSIATSESAKSGNIELLESAIQLSDPEQGNSFILEADLAGGLRVSTVIESDKASHSQKYDFDSSIEPELNEDGSVTLFSADADGRRSAAAQIGAPWAVDVDGNLVDTSYSVEGSSVVQTTVPAANQSYPIVADPYILKWSGINMHMVFTKTDIKKVTNVKQSHVQAAAVSGWYRVKSC